MVTRRIEKGPSTPAPGSSHGSSSSSSNQTPMATPSVSEYENVDPDSPIASIESATPSEASIATDSSPSSPIYTPSTVSLASAVPHLGVRHGSLDQHLQNLRLGSATPQPENNSSGDLHLRRELSSASSTPSIQVTPTPTNSRNEREDSLVEGLNALDMRSASPPDRAPTANQLLGAQQALAGGDARPSSRSPPPSSRRRRSSTRPERLQHNIEDEEPPQSLFHAREIQNALANARQLSGMMVDALSESNLHQEHGSTIHNLHQQAVRLRDFQLPSSRIVGLVGDSGVGKTSLINSVLDKINFARASSNGAACTCVVTEYHYHDRNDFIVEVDYFPPEEIRRQFEQLLRAYRDYQSPDRPGPDSEEGKDLKERADLAINTFNASFKGNLQSTPGVLATIPFGHAIDSLMDWTTQILSQRTEAGRRPISREILDDTMECSERLRILTSESEEEGGTCLWPFIRKIRVHLRAHILSRGLIIADLPGLRDLNSARQNVTERYIRQCHQIFAVARIGRATTDVGVKEVFELARRASLENVGIVCTYSDEIHAYQSGQDWVAERARIAAMQSQIERNEREMERLRHEIDDLEEEAEFLDQYWMDQLLKYRRELDREDASHKQHQFELKAHIINVRNRKVESELRRRYRGYLDGREPSVFCVSNIMYSENRNRPARDALPFLNLSNIIALRRHSVGIVAESHLRATTEYIREGIPAFLGSVDLWVQAGSGNANAEKKQQVNDVLGSVQDQLDELTYSGSEFSEVSENLSEEFKDEIASFMSERSRRWSIYAGRVSRSWDRFHWSSYAAFCRKYGEHQPRNDVAHCWNAEASQFMKTDLSDIWDAFNGNIRAILSRLPRSVSETFSGILSATRSQDPAIRHELSGLTANIRRRRELILHGIENANEDFEERLGRLFTDAVAPVQTAMFSQLVKSAYEDAMMESGTGSWGRKKDIIMGAFGSPTLFQDHRRRFKDKFAAIADKLQERISEVLTTQVSAIEADLDTLRDENVVLESERNPQFRRQLGVEVNRVRREMRALQIIVDDAVGAAREDTPMDD